MANHDLYPVVSRQIHLRAASSDGRVIASAAQALWKRLGLSKPVRLLGVTLSDLTAASESAQLDLFEAATSPSPGSPDARGERLGRTLDAIADRFGENAIRHGAHRPHKITHSGKLKLGEAPSSSEDERDD